MVNSDDDDDDDELEGQFLLRRSNNSLRVT